MGSDLYMEQQYWSPRPSKVTWTSDTEVVIERDAFYTGYCEIYRGKVTKEVKTLLKGLGISLPEKDPTVLYVDQPYKVKVRGKESGLTQEICDALQNDLTKKFAGMQRSLAKKYPDLEIEIS